MAKGKATEEKKNQHTELEEYGKGLTGWEFVLTLTGHEYRVQLVKYISTYYIYLSVYLPTCLSNCPSAQPFIYVYIYF